MFEAFLQPMLLGGMLLVGAPVLIHLIMRQKPRHLMFPAVRFLLQRQRTNQRKVQLRHLLLLLLRMLLIVLVCLALARPRVYSDRLNLADEQPRAVVLLFDVSPSMDYKVGGKTRLDEAKRLALELLAKMPPGSKAAVLDTAQVGGEWLALNPAIDSVNRLQIEPVSFPVTSQLSHAYDLFAKLAHDSSGSSELPPFLFIFSDRTEASWDRNSEETLKLLRDKMKPAVNTAYVDVGVDKPEDLALTEIAVKRPVIASGDLVEVEVTLRATNRGGETSLKFQIDDNPQIDQRPVKIEAGNSIKVLFKHRMVDAHPGPHRVRVALEVSDASLTFNDEIFATFEVSPGRKLLTITDTPKDVQTWTLPFEKLHYQSEVKTPGEAAEMSPRELGVYAAICLMNATSDRDLRNLWPRLAQYVRAGGGLGIIPGGDDMRDHLKVYNDDPEARQLLPGVLDKIVDSPGARWDWDKARYQHPMLSVFPAWQQNRNFDFWDKGREPLAFRYWEVKPNPESSVLVSYLDPKNHNAPAVLERQLDRGRVVLLTTPLDDRCNGKNDRNLRWYDYTEGGAFYLILEIRLLAYLTGETQQQGFNYRCGESVTVPLPSLPRYPAYEIVGGGLIGVTVARAEGENELRVTRAKQRGNYSVVADNVVVAGFSMNEPPEESRLDPRLPVERIEALFGPGSVLALDFADNMQQALDQRWSAPVELFPFLMILLLLALAVENLLANKFYRRDSAADEPGVPGRPETAKPQEQTVASPKVQPRPEGERPGVS